MLAIKHAIVSSQSKKTLKSLVNKQRTDPEARLDTGYMLQGRAVDCCMNLRASEVTGNSWKSQWRCREFEEYAYCVRL